MTQRGGCSGIAERAATHRRDDVLAQAQQIRQRHADLSGELAPLLVRQVVEYTMTPQVALMEGWVLQDLGHLQPRQRAGSVRKVRLAVGEQAHVVFTVQDLFVDDWCCEQVISV